MARATHLLVLGLALALVIGCDEDAPKPRLENRVFVSQTVSENEAPRPLVAGTQLQLRFHEDPRVVASAGCNSMDGRYQIDGGTFVLSGAGITEMGCEQDLQAQDDWYFGFLGSRPSITLDGDTLALDGGVTRIEYLDQEVATPDLPVSGPTWTVDTLIEGDAASTTEWPDPATLSFDADGTLAVFTGCNQGTATYAIDGAKITFDQLVVSEEGCNDQATAQLETVVIGVLGGPQPVTWEIQVARLWLEGDGLGLGLLGSEG